MLRWILVAVIAVSALLFIPIFHSNSEGTLYKGTDGHPWWNDVVFYEIFLRSFYDGNGDGKGDIQGLIEKLDYLNDGNPDTETDLGVTGLWLMPIMPSPSYHGYDVTDYFDINPDYGTLKDFKLLIKEAHKRGIRVIIDLVLNHTSREHPWFTSALSSKSSEFRDYYLWEDEDPGYRSPMGGPVWHKSITGYYYGIFGDGMPDLNLRNPKVIDEIEKISRFWLEDMKVDGFRMDAISHFVEEGRLQKNTKSTHDWLKGFYKMYKSINPNAFAVGEVSNGTAVVSTYGGDEIDTGFEFDTAAGIISSARTARQNPIRAAHAIASRSYPLNQFSTFISNHDTNRSFNEFRLDLDIAKVGATLLLTGPGNPFMYYGEEVGMEGLKPDEDIRLPMQWDATSTAGFTTGKPWRSPNDDIEALNVATQDDDPNSLLNHYRKLIHFRNKHNVMRIGAWVRVRTPQQSVYAFLRQSEKDTYLVLINLSGQPVSDYELSLNPDDGTISGNQVQELFNGVEVNAPTLTDEGGFEAYKPVNELEPYQVLIVEISQDN